jgi:histidinol-phosphate aminotransferase
MYFYRSDLEKKKGAQIDVPHKQIMMCLNESSMNPLGLLEKEILEKLRSISMNRYFSEVTSNLLNELAQYIENDIEPENILMGNGADQMLYYLFLSVRDNDKSFAISLAPSYFDYASYCSAVNLELKTIQLSPSFDFSPDELLAQADDPNCRLMILCNPNNPTGNLLDDEKILQIIKKCEKPVLIDETYFEFSGKTFVELIKKHPNLIIIRSFSKAFSAAGLRFGYLLSNTANIDEIRKVFLAFNLSLVTQAIALALLENRDVFKQHISKIIKNRDAMLTKLNNFKEIVAYPSHTNFLIFTAGEVTLELFDFLSKNEIAVRSMHKLPLLENHLRVTISSDNDNEYFIKKVTEFIEEKS